MYKNKTKRLTIKWPIRALIAANRFARIVIATVLTVKCANLPIFATSAMRLLSSNPNSVTNKSKVYQINTIWLVFYFKYGYYIRKRILNNSSVVNWNKFCYMWEMYIDDRLLYVNFCDKCDEIIVYKFKYSDL